MKSLHRGFTPFAGAAWGFHRASSSKATGPGWRLENRRLRLTVESILLGLAILGVVAWFSTPYFVRDYINRGISGLPDYTGRVEWVRIHPLTASIDIYDVHLDKRAGTIPVHFFYSPRWNIALEWSELLRGVKRATLTIFDAQINLVSGPNPDQSQMFVSKVWIDALRQLIPWHVEQFNIHGGDVHFLDFHARPRVDLEFSQLELRAENINNEKGLKVPLPATVTLTARPLRIGTLEINLAVNFAETLPTFTQKIRMEGVPASGVDFILQKYLKVRARSGEIELYSEINSNKGVYHGYVKFVLNHLEFKPKASDEGNPGAIWSGVLNTANGLFGNERQVIASQVELSGRVEQGHVDAISAIAGVLWNAYAKGLMLGLK